MGGVACVALTATGCASPRWHAPSPELVGDTRRDVYDDSDWAAVLRENVKDGLVDYDHLAGHRQALDRFVAHISVVGPDSTPSLFTAGPDRVAYWINAYNALVLYAVLGDYPTDTMYGLDHDHIEHDHRFTVDGRRVVLRDLVDRMQIESRGDVRIEFALCGAAVGSPPLAPLPYRAETLENQLARVAHDLVDNEQLVRVDHAQRKLLLGQDLIDALDRLVSYYERRTGAQRARPLNALMSFTPSSDKRQVLNRAVGYPVGTIPFDRRLNAWRRDADVPR
jgi:hypothetical protein